MNIYLIFSKLTLALSREKKRIFLSRLICLYLSRGTVKKEKRQKTSPIKKCHFVSKI